MRTRITLCLAGLVAIALPIATVSAAQPVASASPEQQKLGAELARVLNSEELTRAQIRKMLDETLPKTFADTPQFAAMERDYPGITQAVIAAMGPVILDGTLKRLPSLWDRLVPIYTRTFSAAELRTLLDFYTSPAGMRLLKTMGEGADYSRLMGDMLAHGNTTVTTDGLAAGVQTGIAQVVRTSSPEDVKAMVALAATSAGKKLPGVNQQVQAEAAAWGNEEDPKLNAQVQAAVKDAVVKFIGKPAK